MVSGKTIELNDAILTIVRGKKKPRFTKQTHYMLKHYAVREKVVNVTAKKVLPLVYVMFPIEMTSQPFAVFGHL